MVAPVVSWRTLRFDLLDPQANSDKYRDLSAALNALDAYIASGNGRGADSLAANMAGAGIANLNVAWRDQMGRQLNSIRNRMTSMNGGIPCHPVDPKAGVASPSSTPCGLLRRLITTIRTEKPLPRLHSQQYRRYGRCCHVG